MDWPYWMAPALILSPWWRHQMETFSALLALCAGNSLVNSLHKGQWRGAFDVFFVDLRLNTQLSKQSWGWWFEMPLRSLWRHCNDSAVINSLTPDDAIWHYSMWSTLVQVMASGLTAPSHCLNQCWFLISGVLWNSHEVKSTGKAQCGSVVKMCEKIMLKITTMAPRDPRDKNCHKHRNDEVYESCHLHCT